MLILLSLMTRSVSVGLLSSISRTYTRPEHPPPFTPTLRPKLSGSLSSLLAIRLSALDAFVVTEMPMGSIAFVLSVAVDTDPPFVDRQFSCKPILRCRLVLSQRDSRVVMSPYYESNLCQKFLVCIIFVGPVAQVVRARS